MREILLVGGRAAAMVDDVDFESIAESRWYETGDGYACRSLPRPGKRATTQRMHRLITNAPSGMDVDHINHNGLDNRRSNLRVCPHRYNLANQRPRRGVRSSRFKGVYRHSVTGRWKANIGIRNRTIYLGTFDTEIEAAAEYDRAALEAWGEFALLNFPEAANA